MNRGQIRANIRGNLQDAGITYYSEDELNTSIQDAYSLIAPQTFCIIKSATLNWQANKNYYDFVAEGVSDYLGTIAIFNILTNQWLRDDLSLRDFDRLRRDWEVWNGQPQFWTPHSLKYVAIAPKQVQAVGTYTLWYWATAPVFTSDNDTPLVSIDMQTLFEHFVTADMLETAEEPFKSKLWWAKYLKNVQAYAERCLRLAKSDVLLRI